MNTEDRPPFGHTLVALIMPRLVSEGEMSAGDDAVSGAIRGDRETSTRRSHRYHRDYIGGRFRFGSGLATQCR